MNKQKGCAIRCLSVFLNEDAERLGSMFCASIQESHDLSKEIREAFDFVKGTITSYDNPIGTVQGKSVRGDEGKVG